MTQRSLPHGALAKVMSINVVFTLGLAGAVTGRCAELFPVVEDGTKGSGTLALQGTLNLLTLALDMSTLPIAEDGHAGKNTMGRADEVRVKMKIARTGAVGTDDWRAFMDRLSPAFWTTTATEIAEAADEIAKDTNNEAKNGVTWCNRFTAQMVSKITGTNAPELWNKRGEVAHLANDQFAFLEKSEKWEALGFSKETTAGGRAALFLLAQDIANRGGVVICAFRSEASKHGHIAVVVPSNSMSESGTWGTGKCVCKVPYIAQAGPTIQSKEGKSLFAKLELKWAFSSKRAPKMEFFVYKGE